MTDTSCSFPLVKVSYCDDYDKNALIDIFREHFLSLGLTKNDFAGKRAATALKTILPQKYEIIDDRPKGAKDVNDLLLRQLNIQRQTQKKYHNSFER